MKSYFILSMCLLFLTYYFLNFNWLRYLVVIMAFISFSVCIIRAQGFPRILAIGMMGSGIALEIGQGGGIEAIVDGILFVLPLLCILTLAPLLSLPLKIGGYFKALDSFLGNMLHNPKVFFAGITVTLFILSPILNLGSVRLIDEFLSNLKLPSAISSKLYLVGFSTAMFWSPYFTSVTMVLYYLELPVGKYIFFGVSLSLLSLLLGNILLVAWEEKHPLNIISINMSPLESWEKNRLVMLSLYVSCLLFTPLLIEYFTEWSMIVIVSLISIFLPLLWGTFTREWIQLSPHWNAFRNQTVPMMNNEIILFTSAGLFGHAVQDTSFSHLITGFLNTVAHHSFLLFAVSVMGIVITVTYVGIHPIAVVAALAMQLEPNELGISSIALAILLLLAWSLSVLLSPFSGINLLVSKMVGRSGVEVGLLSNGFYVTLVATLGIVMFLFLS
ncbi:hypothetical protein [Bacillus sp. EB01]|uniref:hypothetical protein n=1 Tax=Bacillus sp. EB01 TaxID=1347086 RepID=UPI0005C5F29E|nr:hypothetical protein [Bacillus sp. EB01]